MKYFGLKSICALAIFSLPAFASAISADGTYHEFVFGTAGTAVMTCGGGCSPTTNPVAESLSTPPWTFSSAGPVTLFVLDLFNEGDRFQFFDNNVSVGTTTVVANTGANPCAQDIACAIGTPGYSRLSVVLGAGAHSLTGNVIQNATGSAGGAAVFSVSANATTTPEPASFALIIGAGLVGLAKLRRR